MRVTYKYLLEEVLYTRLVNESRDKTLIEQGCRIDVVKDWKVPSRKLVGWFVNHFNYSSDEQAGRILPLPECQAAFNLWSSLPTANNYQRWITYVWHLSVTCFMNEIACIVHWPSPHANLPNKITAGGKAITKCVLLLQPNHSGWFASTI